MKKFKVVRRFPMDPPVIEKSFDTKEEADAYVEDAREKENRVSGVMGMKASFSVETGELNYESEEETE